MSGDQLNLDALDEMYHRGGQPTMDEGKALVAEVRHLRGQVATWAEWFEAADGAAERRLDQSIEWMERAEAAEAEVAELRASIAAQA